MRMVMMISIRMIMMSTNWYWPLIIKMRAAIKTATVVQSCEMLYLCKILRKY